MVKQFLIGNFPGGPVVKTLLPAGGVGSTPGLGTKIPHAEDKKTLKAIHDCISETNITWYFNKNKLKKRKNNILW